ncbi:MAG: ribosomal L7Ae/L30e/S12e/Gadd45 family protein [Erysipelotrichaceae bacterium]|nr:ribosomal L7Ae/L30e/S12e/Gadd45 family protein [Erysipelotrichaceae bacterium]
MLKNDVLSMLGLAMRARKISQGEVLYNDIRHRRVFLVIISSEASDNTKKKLSDKCTYYHIDYHIIGSIEEISKAIGKENRVAVGIKDRGFADSIKSKLGG